MLRLIPFYLLPPLMTFITSWWIMGRIDTGTWILAGLAGYASSRLIITDMMPRGHGVNGTWHVIGMPFTMFMVYLSTMVLILSLIMTRGFQPQTEDHIHVFGAALLYGWASGLVYWYTFAYTDTWYLSEYHERKALKARGTSDDVIEKIVADLRARKKLPPVTK